MDADYRAALEALAAEFERRADFDARTLRRVSKAGILTKCARDLRALLAQEPAPARCTTCGGILDRPSECDECRSGLYEPARPQGDSDGGAK